MGYLGEGEVAEDVPKALEDTVMSNTLEDAVAPKAL